MEESSFIGHVNSYYLFGYSHYMGLKNPNISSVVSRDKNLRESDTDWPKITDKPFPLVLILVCKKKI